MIRLSDPFDGYGEPRMLPVQCRTAISISVDLPVQAAGAKSPQGAMDFASGLVELFQQSAFPATWSIADPESTPWTRQLARSPLGHEIALVVDPTWAGPSTNRSQFSQELKRRSEAITGLGRRLTTLVLRNTDLQNHLDLLVKYRIPLIREGTPSETRPSYHFPQPQSLRFGVWRAPITTTLQGRANWLNMKETATARRMIGRALREGGFVHLVIDSERLAEKRRTDLSPLRGLLHFIRQHELRGQLAVGPLQEIAARWIQPRAATPSRSVLRRAG
jgi:hypothetical protein